MKTSRAVKGLRPSWSVSKLEKILANASRATSAFDGHRQICRTCVAAVDVRKCCDEGFALNIRAVEANAVLDIFGGDAAEFIELVPG